jgi:hypothetical protein
MQVAVIPAKAGIPSGDIAFQKGCAVDSGFGGNDLRLVTDAASNNTTIHLSYALTNLKAAEFRQ